jgi:Uma2 family endonuclease
MTLEEFYAFQAAAPDDAPDYEYWHGEAIPLPKPDLVHSEVQYVLCSVFELVGYTTDINLDLRIADDFRPKPDVAASLNHEQPYPTKPIEIVAEVLSPEDEPDRVIAKCREYQRIGIGQIFVFDPAKRVAQIWNAKRDRLDEIKMMQLGNGTDYLVSGVWLHLDRLNVAAASNT